MGLIFDLPMNDKYSSCYCCYRHRVSSESSQCYQPGLHSCLGYNTYELKPYAFFFFFFLFKFQLLWSFLSLIIVLFIYLSILYYESAFGLAKYLCLISCLVRFVQSCLSLPLHQPMAQDSPSVPFRFVL